MYFPNDGSTIPLLQPERQLPVLKEHRNSHRGQHTSHHRRNDHNRIRSIGGFRRLRLSGQGSFRRLLSRFPCRVRSGGRTGLRVSSGRCVPGSSSGRIPSRLRGRCRRISRLRTHSAGSCSLLASGTGWLMIPCVSLGGFRCSAGRIRGFLCGICRFRRFSRFLPRQRGR